MDEQIEGVRTLQKVPPGRKIGQKPASDPHYVSLYFGTDWSAVAAAWLTAWERRNDKCNATATAEQYAVYRGSAPWLFYRFIRNECRHRHIPPGVL